MHWISSNTVTLATVTAVIQLMGEGVAQGLGMTVADAQAARETDLAKGLPSFL